MKIDESDRLSSVYLELGCQYFAIARYCASISFGPIYATMFHHAVEMLLKGYLIKSYSSQDLKKVGHNLSKLWSMFKSSAGIKTLAHYDKTITELNRVELLRYPDAMVEHGFVLNVKQGTPTPSRLSKKKDQPQYFVNVSDLDDITLTVFNNCNVNPKAVFRNTPSNFMKTLPSNFALWK